MYMFVYFKILCVSILSARLSVYRVYVWCLRSPAEGGELILCPV